MENIYAYIRNIGCFAVFASVVRLLAPRGSFGGYINLFLSLVFTVVMLNPLSLLLKTELPRLEDYITKNAAAGAELFQWEEDENSEIIYTEYKKMTEERIGELCGGYIEEPKVKVSVITDGGFGVSEVCIEGKILRDWADLKSLISKLYGIEEEKITAAGE